MTWINIIPTRTPRDASTEAYFRSIYSYPLLNPDEEVELFMKMKLASNDSEKSKIREQIINSNLRFVVSVAKQYASNKIPLLDLVQQWNIWLCTAVDRYDSTRWFKFISYAVWRIRQSISSYIMSNKYVMRVPYNRLNIRSKVEKVVSDFMLLNWYEPTYEQILNLYVEKNYPDVDEVPHDDLKMIKWFIDEYVSLMNVNTSIHLDSEVNDDSSTNYYEIIEDKYVPQTDDTLINESLKGVLDNIIDTLSDNQKFIIKRHFSSTPESLSSIADTLWITLDSARRLKKLALKKLKKILTKVPDFADIRDYKLKAEKKTYINLEDCTDSNVDTKSENDESDDTDD